tara:strand:+ start:135 stop:476 length:342 start_codon:yes stop_codon:yes gene_type:complete
METPPETKPKLKLKLKAWKKKGNEKAYYRDYYALNREHINNLSQCNYWRSVGIPDRIIDKFGSHSGAIIKMKTAFQKIIEEDPELIDDVFEELLEPDDDLLKTLDQIQLPYDS